MQGQALSSQQPRDLAHGWV